MAAAVNLGRISGEIELPFGIGTSYEVELVGNLTITVPTIPDGDVWMLRATRDGLGPHTLTFSGVTTWLESPGNFGDIQYFAIFTGFGGQNFQFVAGSIS